MALAVDASSPARVTTSSAGATSSVTAAFNPPISVLIATVIVDPTATVTMSNNGAALTWNLIASRVPGDAGAEQGHAAAYVAVLSGARSGLTVTAGMSTTIKHSLQVLVLTGADVADVIGAIAEGSSTNNSFTTPAITTELANSLGFVVAEDFNARGLPTSPDTTFSGAHVNGMSGGTGYRALGAAGASETFTVNGAGTSSCAWNWIAFEVRAAPDVTTLSGTDTAALADTGSPPGATLAGVDAAALADAGALDLSGTDSAALTAETAARQTIIAAAASRVRFRSAPVTVSRVVAVAASRIDVDSGTVTVSHVVTAAPSRTRSRSARPFGGQTAPDPSRVRLRSAHVDVGVGDQSASAAGRGRALAPPPTIGARLIAQNILTGAFLHWELPITDPEIEWNLSAATTIAGSFRPEITALADVGLEPWATWIHLEEDGVIRGSGILQPTSITPEGVLGLRAVGPMGYASRVPYRSRYSGIGVDPADIVRLLWAHIQGFPRGNLGVTVHGATPVLVGTEERDVNFTTGEGEDVSFVAGPYKLDYWQNTICGAEIDKLAKETPFDVTESSAWTSEDRVAIAHRVDLDYPQRGTRRFDLRFAQDENVIEFAPVEEPDGAYADTVYVAGSGEGIDQVTGEATADVGNRMRLPAIVDDKTITTSARATATAAESLAARMATLVEIPEIVIDTRHRNAPLGAFGTGDEILPQVRLPYVGLVAHWHRVTSIKYLPLRHRAIIGLTRRGEFQ